MIMFLGIIVRMPEFISGKILVLSDSEMSHHHDTLTLYLSTNEI